MFEKDFESNEQTFSFVETPGSHKEKKETA